MSQVLRLGWAVSDLLILFYVISLKEEICGFGVSKTRCGFRHWGWVLKAPQTSRVGRKIF